MNLAIIPARFGSKRDQIKLISLIKKILKVK